MASNSQKLQSIWIVENDQSWLDFFNQALRSNYELRFFSEIANMHRYLDESKASNESLPRLMILEPKSCQGSIMDVLSIKTANGNVLPPLMIVSQIYDLEVMRLCIRMGALDYLVKPAHENELRLKVELAIGKAEKRQSLTVKGSSAGLHIDVHDLTFREYQILNALMNGENHSATRETLNHTVWNEIVVHRKTLDVHLFNLRRKLRPVGYDIICRNRKFFLTKAN